MKLLITSLSIILLYCGSLFAQVAIETERCGTDAYMEEKMQDPAFAQEFLQQKSTFDQQATQKSLMPCTTPLIIPVAVHYNSPITAANPSCLVNKAFQQIAQLNLDYSMCNVNADILCNFAEACPEYFDVPIESLMPEDGTCIQFCLGDQNLPMGEDNINGYAITVGDYNWTGQNTDTQNNWDGFLNIFVSNQEGGGILGVAPLNGAFNPSGNGVYILAGAFGGVGGPCSSGGTLDNFGPFTRGATATHEVGHYFGLQHTFSDNLADTPTQNQPNYGCPNYNTTSCTTTAGSGFSSNFMDYVNDVCMSNFSASQVARMQIVAADQSVWATDKISCYADWQDGTLTYNSCQSFCEGGVCATEASTFYFQMDEICASTSYVLPTNYVDGGLTLDEASSATYQWSLGNYLPEGTPINGTIYTPPTPVECAPEEVLLFLNVGCTSNSSLQINGGAINLTVYPAPSLLALNSLVTFTDGACDGPTWEIAQGCGSFVTVTQNGGPTFPVNSGSGTVNYDITLNYPASCCNVGCNLTATASYDCSETGCSANSGDWNE